MKRISLYLLLACIAIACQKEDELTNRIDHRNLYHRRRNRFYPAPTF